MGLKGIRRSTALIITLGVLRKGMLLSLVFSKVNLTSVPRHTWWIDSGATTHINVSMQGCRKPSDGERYIYVADGKTIEV